MHYILLFIANEFKARTESLITTFKTRTANDFTLLLSLTQLGLLASGTENGISYESFLVNNSWMVVRYSPAPLDLVNCSCSVNFQCPSVRGQFLCNEGNNCTRGTAFWTVPGLWKGCVNLENMLISDLRCFYNQSCINTMLSMYNVDMPDRLPLPPEILATTAMNSSAPSHFLPTDNLGTIFEQLMVEEWDIQSNFIGYYETCAPALCTYRINQRLDIFGVVTSIIALFGGLTVVLRLIIPVIVQFIRLVILRWKNQHRNINAPALVMASSK